MSVPTPNPPNRIIFPDGVGFVELIDTFGDDLTVVNAARVSFDKESHQMTDGDARLIRYLVAHDHSSPFFHPQARFRIKMPLFVAREWYRHTVGFARNEVSRRYVDTAPECWMPLTIRERDPRAKQGSKATAVDDEEDVRIIIRQQTDTALQTYRDLLHKGVAPEIARTILPQSMYTEFIETASIAGYARLCGLRLGPDAQREIQAYAGAVSECLRAVFPVSWEALSEKR
jgi:thymidylate synthase (FAD)